MSYKSFKKNFVIGCNLLIVGVGLLWMRRDLMYTACWVGQQWLGDCHKLEILDVCVDNGFDYFESIFERTDDTMVESIVCPMIDFNEYLYDDGDDIREIFNEISVSRSKPVLIKNYLPFASNYNATFWLKQLNQLNSESKQDYPLAWVTDNNVSTIMNNDVLYSNNILFKDFIEDELISQTGKRIAIANMETYFSWIKDDIISEFIHQLFVDGINGDHIVNNIETTLLAGLGVPGNDDKKLFHSDPLEILIYQFTGEKHWVFVDSKYLMQFRPKMDPNGYNMRTPFGRDLFRNDNRTTQDKKIPLNWDFIPKYECIMTPGDILYIPTFYLHKVDYLMSKYENDFTVSMVAAFFDSKKYLLNNWQSGLAAINGFVEYFPKITKS